MLYALLGKMLGLVATLLGRPEGLSPTPLPFFFFFLQKPSLVPVTGGTVHLRPRGRDGPGFQAGVARPAGASGLFFFLQKPCLSLSPGALVLLMPRGRDGPVFQADVARSAGALDLFFFLFSSRSPLCPCHRGPCTSEAEGKLWARFSFIDLSVLSVLPVVRSTSCSFEVRFFSLWGHFWATSPGMTSRYSLWPVTFLPVSFMLVIFSICSYWTWR